MQHRHRVLAAFLACTCSLLFADEPPAVENATEIVVRDVLVIHGVGKSGRSPVHTDAVEDLLINGRWQPPHAGNTLKSPDGKEQAWSALQADPNDRFESEQLVGGYAYAAMEAPRAGSYVLDAAGHTLVYVNGLPRGGDPYAWGFVRLPVVLRAGRNELLFACGRGELRAKLSVPAAPLMLNTADATLPDLLTGATEPVWGAVVIVNATDAPARDILLRATVDGQSATTELPSVPSIGVRKTPFRIPVVAREPGETELRLELLRAEHVVDAATLKIGVRPPTDLHKRTFISDIDGSVQYFAVRPADPNGDVPATDRGLILSLHGASVEAYGQARCYKAKPWAPVVAPTNRRPFGFDWEDWGRLDALEVLARATALYEPNENRIYLTGHSMGGHGTWHLGTTFAGRWAAIAPSAGWVSFWSYAGGPRPEPRNDLERLVRRATNAGDTLGLVHNLTARGIYILHGDIDDNVPVEQARTMRAALAAFHPNFVYYERPGASHWWGDECMDWPPLMDFLRQNTRPLDRDVTRIDFTTANPAISCRYAWAAIEQQIRACEFSHIELQTDTGKRQLSGKTENVRRLTLELAPFAAVATQPTTAPVLTIDLDGQKLPLDAWPVANSVTLVSENGVWSVVTDALNPAQQKTPARGGPFKQAFQGRMQFVYGTHGTPEENAWALAKTRYDAETWWVRGNGAVDVLADTEFNAAAEPDRGVVLYGHADMNSAWMPLLRDGPIQVRRGVVRTGSRELTGDDLAVLTLYPRPNSATACVAVVAGTGVPGLHLAERLPYFTSGVAFPDWTVLGTDMLQTGFDGVRAAGYFGNDWQFDPEQSAWREKPQ